MRSFVVFLTLSAPKMLVSDGDKDEVYKWKQEKHINDNKMLGSNETRPTRVARTKVRMKRRKREIGKLTIFALRSS